MDEVLTQNEERQIDSLVAIKNKASLPLAEFTFQRILGISPHVTITNASTKKAWVILSPVPIVSISSIGIDKLSISFSTTGEYKCQQFLITPNKSTEYDLDTSQIYYSVFFEFGDVWKTPFKNRKLNTRKYNINLLERHVDNSVDSSLLPT
jgi:hypothetical protein